MEKVQVPEYLYHYTTIDTLHYMFNKPENGESYVEFRFTDFRFMNDAEEGIFLNKYMDRHSSIFRQTLSSEAQKLFDKELVKIDRLAADDGEFFYVMSFGELEDSMQFWRQDYAKDKGICLKINTSKFAELKTKNGNDVPKFCPVKYIHLRDDINTSFPEYKNCLEQEASKIANGSKKIENYEFIHLLDLLPYDVKNAVWQSEQEWRLQMPDAKFAFRNEKHEIDNKGIPRAKIWIDNPFEEIILGPSFTTPYEVTIKKWLSDKGFGEINVRRGDGFLND